MRGLASIAAGAALACLACALATACTDGTTAVCTDASPCGLVQVPPLPDDAAETDGGDAADDAIAPSEGGSDASVDAAPADADAGQPDAHPG